MTEDESAEARRLRAALYRPEATAADLERYERHVHRDAPSAVSTTVDVPPAPARSRSRVPLLIAGAAAIVLVAGIGVVLAARHAAPVTGDLRTAPSASAAATTAVSRVAGPMPLAHDSGAREFAKGPSEVVRAGTFRYTIASGDTPLGIASRFHICLSDVNAGLPLAMQNNDLEPGTAIQLTLAATSVWPDHTVHCVDS